MEYVKKYWLYPVVFFVGFALAFGVCHKSCKCTSDCCTQQVEKQCCEGKCSLVNCEECNCPCSKEESCTCGAYCSCNKGKWCKGKNPKLKSGCCEDKDK